LIDVLPHLDRALRHEYRGLWLPGDLAGAGFTPKRKEPPLPNALADALNLVLDALMLGVHASTTKTLWRSIGSFGTAKRRCRMRTELMAAYAAPENSGTQVEVEVERVGGVLVR
jgi:hypothetical protein